MKSFTASSGWVAAFVHERRCVLAVDEHHDEHLHQQLEDWDAAPPALDGLEWRHGDDLRGGKKGIVEKIWSTPRPSPPPLPPPPASPCRRSPRTLCRR
jgi:hypothetical protein